MYLISMVIGTGGDTQVVAAGAVVNTTNLPANSIGIMIGNGAALTQHRALVAIKQAVDRLIEALKRDQSAAVAYKVEIDPTLGKASMVETAAATVALSAETKFSACISQAGGKGQTELYKGCFVEIIERLREDVNLKLVLGVAA